MSKAPLFFEKLEVIHPGLTQRKQVIDILGSPKNYKFEDDFKVIYTYPQKGVEITIKMGHVSSSSLVSSVLVKKPFERHCSNSLKLGMEFSLAENICNELYVEKFIGDNYKIYSIPKEKILFQIWERKNKLIKMNIFTD